MITLLGAEGSAEYAVAKSISDAFANYWPGISESPQGSEDLRISANTKISGYGINDIDIVICGRFRPGRRFVPTRSTNDIDGKNISSQPVRVENLIIAIEVKSHSAERIEFENNSVKVRYTRNGVTYWESATEQNEKQVHTLRKYFDAQHIDAWVYRLIMLPSLTGRVEPDGVLSESFKTDDFLTELASFSPPLRGSRGHFMRSVRDQEEVVKALGCSLFRRTVPTNLDRKKMDRIASRKRLLDGWVDELGHKTILFRGRGGAGKTILLLQLAHSQFKDKASLSLVLTYNRALAADIQRSMSLMRVPSTRENGGIHVQTVMSFIMTWLQALGLLDIPEYDSDSFTGKYLDCCSQTIQMFEEGLITQEDIKEVKESNIWLYDFDYVLIDEGQDWPLTEAKLIGYLYGAENLVIADGVDQLVRGQRIDWSREVSKKHESSVITLRRCLRMKANLARFSNTLASRAGIAWDVEPNDEAGGGKIIIIEGSYLNYTELHNDLCERAEIAGNKPVDMLFCVPSGDVTEENGKRSSRVAKGLEAMGNEVWDATDEVERKDFPRGAETFRVVQYASCRGLEGWVVVAEHLDDFWLSHSAHYQVGINEKDPYKTESDIAAEAAWKWVLIVMTRPIDTLVVTLSNKDSEVGRLLNDVSKDLPDMVEWFKPSTSN